MAARKGEHTAALVVYALLGLLIVCCLQALTGCMVGEDAEPSGTATRVRGTLTISISDDFVAQRFHPVYTIDGVELVFPGAPPAGLTSGQNVEAIGSLDGGRLTVAPGDNAVLQVGGELQQAITSSVRGTHSVLILPVSFRDDVQSCTSAQINTLMFAPTNSVATYYTEMSFGAFTFTGSVAAPVTIDTSASLGCDLFGWGNLADAAAAAAGISEAVFQHVVYVFPHTSSSCVVGLGNLPGSRVWIGGDFCAEGDVYAHELGHNIGMHHANTLTQEYADVSDVMGFGLGGTTSGLRQTNGPHRFQVGWTGAQTISATGTYRIRLLETAGTEPQVLTFAQPGSTDSLFLSYRRAVGFDTNLTSIQAGFPSFGTYTDRVSIHRWNATTPSAVPTVFLASVADNASFADTGITVVQKSHDAGFATVDVTFGTPTVDTTPPTIAFLAPQAGATVAGTVAVNVDASDDVGVTSVRIAIDGAVVATLTAPPFTAQWNTVLSGNGSHTLSATASDAAGHTTTASIQATVTNAIADTTPPSVAFAAPTPGATVSGTTRITIDASDNIGVTRVELAVDGVVRTTLSAFPFVFDLDTKTLANGSHQLRAAAFDAAGNSASQTITVTVSNVVDATPPTASITAPANGATVAGTISVSVAASDDVGVLRVELLLDGALVATDTVSPFAFSLSTTTLANGAHTLVARAADASGKTGNSSAVSVTVANPTADTTPPTVAITQPTTGSTVRTGSTVTIVAAASDDVGVARVDFFVSGNLQCSRTAAPFSCAFRVPKQAGRTFTFQAKALDAAGNGSSSALVSVRSAK